MLANNQPTVSMGMLTPTLHRPGSWLDAVIDFILIQLPLWRDEPGRPPIDGENALSAQLTSFLTSACTMASGFDMLQFKQEEPDSGKDGRRKIDVAVHPKGAVISINGRSHSHYKMLVPIECKRLPKPTAGERREYLHRISNTTGGVQRFKQGLHGSDYELAVMIGYVQRDTIPDWHKRIERWVRVLARAKVALWSIANAVSLNTHDATARTGSFISNNSRSNGLAPIRLRHLWIEMT
ncbi:hypothetical protein [Novosphingobium sp. fls2-241-R2A-195]|uniref:hypothetical protein n=1 Tax=Novosphingobium sp. fls2-241-R2A-195 TaxID=3040296 RepID=UPI002551B1C9|nr:hypothetical protein [Novosphingobium sp. fls2-241-R2A-195]